MAPGDIPGRIQHWLTEHGEHAPQGRPEIVRCIIESLAQAFAEAVQTAAALADQDVSVIHIVGGGSQNTLLCQATADRSGLRVLAGPVEATAMGNMLVQLRSLGQLRAPGRLDVPGQLGGESDGGLDAIRAVVANSAGIVEYLPHS